MWPSYMGELKIPKAAPLETGSREESERVLGVKWNFLVSACLLLFCSMEAEEKQSNTWLRGID